MIYDFPSLTKSFEIISSGCSFPRIFVTNNKLVITYSENYNHRKVEYEIWDLNLKKLINWKITGNEDKVNLEVTKNYLFIKCNDWGGIYQISLENDEKDREIFMTQNSAARFSFLGVLENKLFYTFDYKLFFLENLKDCSPQEVKLNTKKSFFNNLSFEFI